MGICISLTDTGMWKLGLRPHNSLSGDIYLEFSVLCLWSVWPFFYAQGREGVMKKPVSFGLSNLPVSDRIF